MKVTLFTYLSEFHYLLPVGKASHEIKMKEAIISK
jgi:hypothetical protein